MHYWWHCPKLVLKPHSVFHIGRALFHRNSSKLKEFSFCCKGVNCVCLSQSRSTSALSREILTERAFVKTKRMSVCFAKSSGAICLRTTSLDFKVRTQSCPPPPSFVNTNWDKEPFIFSILISNNIVVFAMFNSVHTVSTVAISIVCSVSYTGTKGR